MKYLISAVLLLLLVQMPAKASPIYNVYLVTWDKVKVLGRFEAITDSTISIKGHNGKTYTISASKTRHLNIWRKGIILPSAIAGATILTQVWLKSIPENENALAGVLALFIGIPLGTIAGLITGDIIATKFNKRNLHITDFEMVRSRLPRALILGTN